MNIAELVFTGFNRRVAALHRPTGRIVWQWRAPQGSRYVSLLLESNLLVVSVDGFMYGLNPLTGAVLWFNPMEGFGTGVTSLVSVNGTGSSPVMAAAAPQIAAAVPGVQFIVARAPNLSDRLFESFGIPGVTLRIVEGRTDDVLHAADTVVTASGTATVQTALHGKPMVVLYKLSPLTYRLGRRMARVDMYAMVNLIAGQRIVQELIQDDCTAEAVAAEAVRITIDTEYRERMVDHLAEVCRRLGGSGASDRAAEAVLDVVHSANAS